jgi:hypothetical protein
MTKKHFIELADTIRGDHAFDEHHLNVLADFCQSQNPHFNRNRWLGYIKGECGKNGGKV